MSFNAKLFDVIRKPLITEKALASSEYNKYIFLVDVRSDKCEVKKAIESIFEVKVKKVNILNLMGKVKKFKGRIGKRADQKKAVVTLLDGYSIDAGLGRV